MAKQRTDLSIPWPFAPSGAEVALNRDTNRLKVVAMLTMLCDHAGKMLFPQYRLMRIIGRIAFPIYAYCIAAGCVYTRNPLNYLRRVVLLALISQPLYAVAMAHETGAMYAVSLAEQPVRAVINFYVQSWSHPNILVSLAFGVMMLWALRERQLVLFAGVLLLTWFIKGKLDYGYRGMMLMLLFYIFISKRWLSLPVLAAFMIWWGMQGSGYNYFGLSFGIQTFAILALPFIYIRTNSKLRLPKWLFYGFYPAHLVLILILNRFVMK